MFVCSDSVRDVGVFSKQASRSEHSRFFATINSRRKCFIIPVEIASSFGESALIFFAALLLGNYPMVRSQTSASDKDQTAFITILFVRQQWSTNPLCHMARNPLSYRGAKENLCQMGMFLPSTRPGHLPQLVLDSRPCRSLGPWVRVKHPGRLLQVFIPICSSPMQFVRFMLSGRSSLSCVQFLFFTATRSQLCIYVVRLRCSSQSSGPVICAGQTSQALATIRLGQLPQLSSQLVNCPRHSFLAVVLAILAVSCPGEPFVLSFPSVSPDGRASCSISFCPSSWTCIA